MLEKHKDYVERARNMRQKKSQMKEVRRRIQNRNPDEFRFQMENARLDTATGKRRLLASRLERERQEKFGKQEQQLLQRGLPERRQRELHHSRHRAPHHRKSQCQRFLLRPLRRE